MIDKYVLLGIEAEKYALNGLTIDDLKKYLTQFNLFGTIEEFKSIEQLQQKVSKEINKEEEEIHKLIDKIVNVKVDELIKENEKLRRVIKENNDAHEKIIMFLNNLGQSEVK